MSGLWAVLYREYLMRVTSSLWLFFDLLVPVLYLLVFGVGFNAAFGSGIETGGRMLSYNEFFVAGVLCMACFGLSMNQSYGFFTDRDNGIFYETLTYPITRGEFLLGKILFQCVLAVAQTLFTLLAATLILGVSISVGAVPVILGGVLLGTAGWFFTFAAFAFRVRRSDTFNTVLNLAYFLLLFLSSLFYPLDKLPSAFVVVAYANPVTWQTDVLRWAINGTGTLEIVALEAVGFLVFSIVCFRVALRSLEKALE